MNNAMSKSALQAGVDRLQVEAGGVLELIIVRPPDAVGILGEAIAGSETAARIFRAVSTAATGIAAAPRHRPMLCVSCPRPLRKKTPCSFVLVLPKRADAAEGLTLAVCAKCATKREDIQVKALVGLRRIWPDLRPIEITHEDGGRA